MGLGQHFHKEMRDGVGQGIRLVGFLHAVNKTSLVVFNLVHFQSLNSMENFK